MKKHFLLLASLMMVTFYLGCSSWDLKNRCEQTNWFEYSQGVANSGRYLEEDRFVSECRSVDRINAQQLDQGFKLGREKMCTYDELMQRGVRGEPVSFALCDALDPSKRKAKYQEGLVVFCTNDSGYSYGKSGHVYQKVCSPQLELQFLPGYQKGRREYLTDQLANKKALVANQKHELQELTTQQSHLANAYASIPKVHECRDRLVYDEISKKNENKTICTEATYLVHQRTTISDSLESTTRSIKALRERIAAGESVIQAYQNELVTLPN